VPQISECAFKEVPYMCELVKRGQFIDDVMLSLVTVSCAGSRACKSPVSDGMNYAGGHFNPLTLKSPHVYIDKVYYRGTTAC